MQTKSLGNNKPQIRPTRARQRAARGFCRTAWAASCLSAGLSVGHGCPQRGFLFPSLPLHLIFRLRRAALAAESLILTHPGMVGAEAAARRFPPDFFPLLSPRRPPPRLPLHANHVPRDFGGHQHPPSEAPGERFPLAQLWHRSACKSCPPSCPSLTSGEETTQTPGETCPAAR